MRKQYFLGYFSYVLLGRKLENLFRFSFSGTRNIVFGTPQIGQNDPDILNLEFENQGVLKIKFSFQPNKLGQIYVE